MKASRLPRVKVLLGLAIVVTAACGRDGLSPVAAGLDAGGNGAGGAGGRSTGDGGPSAGGTAGDARNGNGGASGTDGGFIEVAPGDFPLVVLPRIVPPLPVSKSVRVRALVQIAGVWRDLSTDPAVLWQSVDPAIADVAVGSGRITGQAIGNTVIRASHALFGSAEATVTVTSATVSSVTIEPPVLDILVGQSGSASAQARYNDGTIVDVTDAATWTANDQRIARVQNSVPPLGEVTGVLAGQTAITAAFADVTGAAAVTVNAAGAETLSVAPSVASETIGETIRFQAVLRLATGVVTDATNLAAWSSSNPGISRSVGGGQFRCSAAGMITVTALHLGKTATASLQCTTNQPVVTELRISPSGNASLFVTTRYRLMLEATFSDGSVAAVTSSQARWSSSNTTIASIDNNATLTGLMPGVATISVAYAGKTASEAYTFIAR